MNPELLQSIMDLLEGLTQLIKDELVASEKTVDDAAEIADDPESETSLDVIKSHIAVGFGKDTEFGENEVVVNNPLVSGKGGLKEAIAKKNTKVVFTDEVLKSGLIVDTTIRPKERGVFVDFKGMTLKVTPAMEKNLAMQLCNSGVVMINFVLDGRGIEHSKTTNAIAITQGEDYILDTFAVLGYLGDDSLSIGSKQKLEESADRITIGRYFSDAAYGTSKSLLINCDVDGQRTAQVTVHSSWLNGEDRQTRNTGAIVHPFGNVYGPDRRYGCNDCVNEGKEGSAYKGLAVTIAESNYYASSDSGKNVVERTVDKEPWQGDSLILVDGLSVYEKGCTQGGNVKQDAKLRAKYIPYETPAVTVPDMSLVIFAPWLGEGKGELVFEKGNT